MIYFHVTEPRLQLFACKAMQTSYESDVAAAHGDAVRRLGNTCNMSSVIDCSTFIGGVAGEVRTEAGLI